MNDVNAEERRLQELYAGLGDAELLDLAARPRWVDGGGAAGGGCGDSVAKTGSCRWSRRLLC